MNNLNAAALIRAGRSVPEPFQLAVAGSDGRLMEVTIKKILRLLPARRIVAVAETNGVELLVKIFVGRSAARYIRREIRGVTALREAGLATPALLWQGQLPEGGGHVVAFEFINGASDLMDVWSLCRGPEKEHLLKQVTSELSSMHTAGVVQNDIHPENFLIQGDRILTIDGGDVRRQGSGPLNESLSLKNLGLFLAQFQAEIDDAIPDLLVAYCALRGWSFSEKKLETLLGIVRAQRAARKHNHISKAFRECTRFTCRRQFSRFSVCERKYDSPEMRAILAHPDSYMASGKLLKDGNTATVARIEGPDGPLVVKRYNIKGLMHWLERVFRPSRAWVSWANSFRLEFLEIKTPPPVAMIEERIGPLRKRAYFITEYVEGQTADQLTGPDVRDTGLKALAEVVTSLAEAGISHGDMKASNFLLTPEGAVVLDLDAMRDNADAALIRRDQERFLENWAQDQQTGQKLSALLPG